jgi:hypothetical protein
MCFGKTPMQTFLDAKPLDRSLIIPDRQSLPISGR